MTIIASGGCQCGRVRYTAHLPNHDAYLCHCRMCQRATGGFAASFVNLPREAVRWDSEPDWYESSAIAKRPFCARCGTPLGFRYNSGPNIDLTVGSFDDPAPFVPTEHSGAESMHEAWLDTSALPRQTSSQSQGVVRHWREAGLQVPE